MSILLEHIPLLCVHIIGNHTFFFCVFFRYFTFFHVSTTIILNHLLKCKFYGGHSFNLVSIKKDSSMIISVLASFLLFYPAVSKIKQSLFLELSTLQGTLYFTTIFVCFFFIFCYIIHLDYTL